MYHMRAKEVAAYMGVSIGTVWNYTKKGLLNPIRITSQNIIYNKQEVDNLLNGIYIDKKCVILPKIPINQKDVEICVSTKNDGVEDRTHSNDFIPTTHTDGLTIDERFEKEGCAEYAHYFKRDF